MDSPNPDPGEEFQHTNTQLFNELDEANRFKDATEMVAPYNAPPAGTAPTMDGFVTDYINFFTVELGGSPLRRVQADHDGLHPRAGTRDQRVGPGLRGVRPLVQRGPLADHGQPVLLDGGDLIGFRGEPADEQLHAPQQGRDIFDRLERNGKTWKVYVLEPDPISFTGVIHMARLRERFDTNFVPFAEFERDAAAGTLPDFPSSSPISWPATATTTPLSAGPCSRASRSPSIHPHRSWPVRRSWAGFTTPSDAASTTGRTSSTRCSSLASTNPVAPTTTSPRSRSRPRTSTNRGNSGSPSIARATGSRPSSSRPGCPRGPSSPTSTGTPPCWPRSARCGIWVSRSRPATPGPDLRDSSASTPRAPETWPDIDPLPVPRFQAEQVSSLRAVGTLGHHVCHGLYEHRGDDAASRTLRPPIPRSRRRWLSTSPSTSGPGCSRGLCHAPQLTERAVRIYQPVAAMIEPLSLCRSSTLVGGIAVVSTAPLAAPSSPHRQTSRRSPWPD